MTKDAILPLKVFSHLHNSAYTQFNRINQNGYPVHLSKTELKVKDI